MSSTEIKLTSNPTLLYSNSMEQKFGTQFAMIEFHALIVIIDRQDRVLISVR